MQTYRKKRVFTSALEIKMKTIVTKLAICKKNGTFVPVFIFYLVSYEKETVLYIFRLPVLDFMRLFASV